MKEQQSKFFSYGTHFEKGDIISLPRNYTRWERIKMFFGFYVPEEKLFVITNDIKNEPGEVAFIEPFDEDGKSGEF